MGDRCRLDLRPQTRAVLVSLLPGVFKLGNIPKANDGSPTVVLNPKPLNPKP